MRKLGRRAPKPGRPGGSGGANYKRELNEIITNLNREIMGISERSLKGLIKVSVLIRRETEKGNLVTPVDLGNLRASWFVVTSQGKIHAGGGKTHTVEGGGTKFRGINVSRLSSGHSAAITEAQAEASILSNRDVGPYLILGYSAFYAGYVHEFVDPDIKWKRPRSGAKWLQAAIFSNKDKILEIIRNNAKIPK